MGGVKEIKMNGWLATAYQKRDGEKGLKKASAKREGYKNKFFFKRKTSLLNVVLII
jgi:hypothetical protein